MSGEENWSLERVDGEGGMMMWLKVVGEEEAGKESRRRDGRWQMADGRN